MLFGFARPLQVAKRCFNFRTADFLLILTTKHSLVATASTAASSKRLSPQQSAQVRTSCLMLHNLHQEHGGLTFHLECFQCLRLQAWTLSTWRPSLREK